MDVITYPCWDWNQSVLVKGAHGVDMYDHIVRWLRNGFSSNDLKTHLFKHSSRIVNGYTCLTSVYCYDLFTTLEMHILNREAMIYKWVDTAIYFHDLLQFILAFSFHSVL